MKTRKGNVICSGDGTPVLLLHSAMSSKLQWYQLIRSMSDKYKMIACDLYGYGDSPFPWETENYSLDDEIAWVDKTIEGQIPGDRGFHIVGHSYGAAVGLRMALNYPGQVRSMTLFEPVSFHILPQGDPGLEEALAVSRKVEGYMASGKNLEAADFFIDFYSEVGTFRAMPRSIQELLAASIKKLPHDFHALLNDSSRVEDYSKIDCPLCLIVGKKSPLSSTRIAEYLHKKIPSFQLQWIDEGHMAPLYHPEIVNPIISDFINKNK